MSIPTYDDWLQWRNRDAIEECEQETRGRFEAWVQQVLRRKLSEKKYEEQRSRLSEYFEDTGDSPTGRRRCAAAFDKHLLKGRNKTYLFAARPLIKDGTKKRFTKLEQTIAWAKVAKTMICRDVLRDILKDLPPPGSVPIDGTKRNDDGDEGRPLTDILSDDDQSVEDQATAGEVAEMASKISLSDRERLILWADQHCHNRCSPEMERLAGIRRAQLSQCARDLETRLGKLVQEFFLPETLPPLHVCEYTAVAWEALTERHRAVRPERVSPAPAPLRWVCVRTKGIVQPEKQPDGSFIWKRVAAPAAPQPI